MRILVPTDGSPLSDRILRPLGPLLEAAAQEVVLMQVIRAEADDAAREVEALAARAHLEEVADRLPEARRDAARYVLSEGDPAEEILARVREVRPDLVAMATHGRTGLTRLVRGSVAERVLRSCPAPLLLANPQALDAVPAFRRLLVPLDGSAAADRVLPLVARFAGAFGAEVTLLRVRPLPPPLPTAQDQVEGWSEARVRESLAPRARRLEAAGARVRVAVRTGYPAEEVLAAADEADLVAMSTHGRAGVARWWFGSLAEQVLRACARPLLVLRVAEAVTRGARRPGEG